METRTEGKVTEIVAYKLSDSYYRQQALDVLKDYLKRNKLTKHNPNPDPECFAIRSAFYDVIKQTGNLDTWYTPIYREYKTISIERAKSLEASIKIFTGEYMVPDLKEHWRLTNEDGSKHEDSDEFVQAYREYHKSREKLISILSK